MFLFINFIISLENILSHFKLGVSTTISAIVGIATIGGRTTTVAFTLLSVKEYEKFGGGSYTSNLLSHLLKLST